MSRTVEGVIVETMRDRFYSFFCGRCDVVEGEIPDIEKQMELQCTDSEDSFNQNLST